MNNFEIQDCLDSMIILVDSREQDTPRARERYSRFGVPFKRCTLNYGDYTYNCKLPDGSDLNDTSVTISSKCCIERKMNLDELAQCFTHSRERFENEFKRANENGAKIYLLVENATWESLLNGKYRSKYNSKAFAASVIAWTIRYGMQIMFCKSETSGHLIKEILYRELKNRLEKGDCDIGRMDKDIQEDNAK